MNHKQNFNFSRMNINAEINEPYVQTFQNQPLFLYKKKTDLRCTIMTYNHKSTFILVL